MKLEGLDHVALYARDPTRTAAWYRDVLGLERRYQEAWGDVPVVMIAGTSGVAIFPAGGGGAEPSVHARVPGAFAHVAFRVRGDDLAAARTLFRERGIPCEEQDHGIARSLYVRDPDGHQVELTTYDVG